MVLMAETTQDPYPTGTYKKGDKTRRAETTADAVQAVFDGYKRVQEDADVAGPTAAVNDNDPESTRSATEGEGDESATPAFESDAPSDTSATPDEPSGTPVDDTDPSRSAS